MASTVNTRFRQFLPGAGFDSAGNAVQGKTRVVGHVNVSSYNGGGESLTPRDIGLTNIDSITLRVRNQVPGADGKHVIEASYAADSQQFYLVNVGVTTATGAAVRTHFSLGSSNEVVEFVAEGDSAHNVELT